MDKEFETADEKMERLMHALNKWEVAKFLTDTCGEDAVKAARFSLAKYEAEKQAAEELEVDLTTLQGAMAKANEDNALDEYEPSWKPKKITLGVNKTKIGLHGKAVNAKPDAPIKKFNQIVNAGDSTFKKLTSEDSELPWAGGSNTPRNVANRVQMLKRAAKRSIENRKACEAEHCHLNETAMSILKSHLKEGVAGRVNNDTAAAKTIVAKPMTSEPSVRDQLPREFQDSGLLPARSQKDIAAMNAMRDRMSVKVAAEKISLTNPADFNPRIQKSEDNSYNAVRGRMKSDTAAAATIARPTNIKFNDEEASQQLPQVPEIEPPLKNGESMAAATYPQNRGGKAVRGQDQFDVSLKSPAPPKQGFASVNGAI